MKKSTKGAISRTSQPLGLALAILLNLHAGDGLAGQGVGNNTGVYQACPTISNATTPTAKEAEQLAFMREEEKLARDVYLTLYEKWQQPVFKNISLSEQTHMDQVKCFLDAYGLPDSAKTEAGQFNNSVLQGLYDSLTARGMASLSEALRVGGEIEEVDIRDLRLVIDDTGIAEVKIMYGSLMSASENHLRAFVSNLLTLGESYATQVLSEQSVAAILSGDRSVAGGGINIGNGNVIGTQARCTTRVQTGVTAHGGEIQITQQTRLTLTTDCQTDPVHIGQSARLVNVVLYQPHGSRVVNAYQLGAQGGWQSWSGDLPALDGVPVQLQASHSTSLFNGNFQNMPGYFQVYGGYLLNDGTLAFTSLPMTFGVLP